LDFKITKRAQGTLFGVVLAFFAARIVTLVYFWNCMPRSPEPQTGKIYPATAAWNTLVYVTRRQFAWQNILENYLMTIVGVVLVLVAVFVIIPEARRAGQL